MTELEQAEKDLHDGRPLDEQLLIWEKGMALTKEADAILGAIEKRIEIVLADGEVKEFGGAE